MPNLSGAFGGAAHLAGAEGNTHLDGGTRIAGGQAPSRPAPETVPNQVGPDAATSTVQQPAGAPPMAGGFVPGPVAGGGGASHASGGGTRTPSTSGEPRPTSQRPAEPTPQLGGGTLRPGAGRSSDSHLPPPPPPSAGTSQHGTADPVSTRTVGDPHAAPPSTSRSGRTGDEHLPPPPPPQNTRVRPLEERPTEDELAQLHQHPDGPALIHPPATDPAALQRYKNTNKFNFRLTDELGTAANALPHSSWGRHDSGSLLPDGRPDVKVSPYSQSFKSHLDPLTLKALHPIPANAVTPHLRNELGPDAMAFQGNHVLEAAGSLDFRTQEHFQQQEIRRNVLERLARQDSQQSWHPVGEQRVTEHLDGSTSAMDGVNRLLGGHDGRPGFGGIVLGEAHNQSPSWSFLNENMHDLKAAGVDKIFVESLRDDAFQQHLDAFQRPDGTMSPNLEKMLRAYDRSQNSPAGAGLYDTVVKAKAEGVTVHAVDGYPARRPTEGGRQALEERARLLNSYMNHAISESGGSGKYVLVTGKSHVHEHASSSEHRIPGVAEMLGAPAVRLTDVGRPNSSGAPHDASVNTDPGDVRLGYLAPESTGQDPANATQHQGGGIPPAPPAPPTQHVVGGSQGNGTRSLGDRTPPPPPPPPAPPAPPAPPTQHTPPSTQHTPPGTGQHTPPTQHTPSTQHTPPGTTQHTPSTGAHDQFLDRQKQERDAELQALSGKSPVRDAVDQLGREQRSVATPPVNSDRLRQDLPTMSPQARAQELANMTPENRRWLARDPQTVDALKNGLPPKEFAKTAADLLVHVDPRAERAATARQEAKQQIARMLQDPETAARLLKNGADVVVVPKDVRMPDVPELNNLRGVHNNSSAGAGRGYDDMRGSGGRHSAVTEENLLGEHTSIGQGGHYEDGYSTTTHEFTHTVHKYGLETNDQKLITDTFNQKLGDPKAAWPDGPRHDGSGKPVDNYSSRDEQEYFAQVTNAYLGTNHGTDPYTGQPRNNGADWVRQNEPAMLPLLEKLYGKDPSLVHEGPANPVHATTADTQMYDGFREFMDGVEGNGNHAPSHQPPSTPPPPTPQQPGRNHGQQGGSSHLPAPPPKPPAPKAAVDDGYSHKIDGAKTLDAIKDFLPDTREFDKVKDTLKKYERSPLVDGDTAAIMDSYRTQKQLHVDLLRRNVPESLDVVNHRLDEIARETPNRQAELAAEKHNLETAKAALDGQRDRMAVYDHELARLKGEPKPGTPQFKALEDARRQAEPSVTTDAIARIEEQRTATADLRQRADQRFDDAEVKYQDEKNKRIASGAPKESSAEAAAKTSRNVYESRVKDLERREQELMADLTARKDALAGTYAPTPPKPKKGSGHEATDGAYRAAFGYSDHGVMSTDPHAEKTVRRVDTNGKVSLSDAVVNRNHVVADYMVHKYVTAAVFKARSFGDEQHRAEASNTFADFADTLAPDQHRVFDTAGKGTARALGRNGLEHAALTVRDLGYTAADVDLGKAYGNEELAPAFSPAKTDDPASAGAAKQELQNQLGRSGLDGPAKAEFDRYADTVAKFSDDPSPQHLAEMKAALGDVHTKVREQAVEDLAVVHGVTGPRHLDDTVAAARQAAAEPPGGPGRSPAHERLADRLDDLAGAHDRLGSDRQDLKGLAHDLRNDPNSVQPEQLRALADTLPKEREQLRKDEVQRRLDEAGETLKPGGSAAAKANAAAKHLTGAEKHIGTVGRQYGGAYPRAGAGENHPAGLFDQALHAKVEDVPKLIEDITAGLSNSASNLRFGDELTNKWIQNFLDPHVIRDQDVLTAVAKGDLPPEALYSPHTLDLLRGLRTLEDTGLAPRELRDLMAPKTEADMVELHQPGKKPSPSAVNIADEHGMLTHAGGRTPVSSSGDLTHQPHQSANPAVGIEGMHHPVRDAQPGTEGHEIGTTPPPVTPRPQTPDTDVLMASPDHETPMATQNTDVPMASQQTVRPAKRPLDPDEDTLMTDAPPTKRRQADVVLPPPPPPVSHGAGTRGFGSLPSPPPPATAHGTGVPAHQQPGPTEAHGPAQAAEAVPQERDVDGDTVMADRSVETAEAVPQERDGDGDTVMADGSVETAEAVPQERDADGDTVMADAAHHGRKRGREEDEEPGEEPDAKRRRTPAYENSHAVMADRGYQQIDPQHPLTGELVDYLGGAPRMHPPMSNSLLQKVNPHQAPTKPAADFRPGNDLNACLENVEAYRDTHFGRPRVSGRTEHGTVEPIPGNTLWKRHDGPALFGQGTDAVQKLMERVRAGGPGAFATVLGIGASGSGHGHAVALVHDRDGTLRWADLTDRKVTTANGGAMPDNYRSDWTVWASVADPHENNISGPHDPQFMERFSTFGESDHPSDPMDIDTFGTSHRADPDSDTASVRSDDESSTEWHDAVERMSDRSDDESSTEWHDAVEQMSVSDHSESDSDPRGNPVPARHEPEITDTTATQARTQVLDGDQGGAPKGDSPQQNSPKPADQTSARDSRSEDAPDNGGTVPVTPRPADSSSTVVPPAGTHGGGGSVRPRSASDPSGLGTRTSAPRRSDGSINPSMRGNSSRAAESHTSTVTSESHTTTVAPESHTSTVTSESHTTTVAPESHTTTVTSESHTTTTITEPGAKTGQEGVKEEGLETPLTQHSEHAPVTEFPPVGARVPVKGDGLCLIHSLERSYPGLAERHPEGLQNAVGQHFGNLRPEDWPTEVLSNYRNYLLSRPNLGESKLLEFLPEENRPAFVGMPDDQLRGIISDHLAVNSPDPSPREQQDLRDTVGDWANRWGSDEGEMLPAAAAHALDLRLRVVDHDGITQAVFGPPGGTPVTVYHRGNHYDGSEPQPGTPETGHTPPAAEPEVKAPESEQPPLKTPESESKPLVRGTVVKPKPIAGTDLVVGLTGHETDVREKVIDMLARAVPGDRAAVRAFADANFGPATLRPMLSALSRGEAWTAPFEGNGWSGSVKLRGRVAESTYMGQKKIEFEDGADRTVAIGTNRDSAWQFNIGAQTRQARGIGEPQELVAYYHDRGQAEVNMDLGGTVARSKTNQEADLFRSTMRLELDFNDLSHHGTPVSNESAGRTETVDLGLAVAVPQRPEITTGGEQRVPPRRLQDGRVGGQEVVLDLSPRGASHDRPPVEALLEKAEAAAKEEFGNDWPAMRDKVLAEVDFARLQRDLKSMTAGEPVSVTLTDRRGNSLGTVEITARVGELKQVGTTKESEFNIGTSMQQVRSASSNSGHAGQLGFSSAVKPSAALVTPPGVAGRLGRDTVSIVGEARTSQLTSKSKVPGVVYDGAVHFDLSFNGRPVASDAGAADVRLLVDRADTAPEPAKVDPAGTEPKGGTAPELEGTAPKAEGSTEPQLREVVSPPASVWHSGDDTGGLGETVVVRDLESTKALRAAVDTAGRAKFGDDWDAVRDQVMRGFSQPNLSARLTGMTRGEPLEIKIPGKESLVVTAVARVETMTYRREDEKAELNTVNETSSFSLDRRLGARTTIEQGYVGGTPVKGAPGLDLTANASAEQRRRSGGQGRQADRVYASGKYSAPQVIYGTELVMDIHIGRPGEAIGGRPAASVPVRAEVGMDARDTVKVQAPRTEDGVIDFKRPAADTADGAVPKPDATTSAVPKPNTADGTVPKPDATTSTAPKPDATTSTAPKPDATTSAAPKPAATHNAPSRMREQQELNASYVVHSLSGADKVRSAVEEAVRSKHDGPSDEVQQRINASFDRVALKTQLSQLTRGGKITQTVSGKTWSAEITVRARLGDATYHSQADKYEFESGTRVSSGQGNLHDGRDRMAGGGRANIKAPFVSIPTGYGYRVERTYGQTTETIGSVSNRGKHVEKAVFFDVNASYDVEVKFTQLGLPHGTVTRQVDTVARVAVPERDAEPVGGRAPRVTTKQPKSFVDHKRLDSSAVVTDVHILPDPAPTVSPTPANGAVDGAANGSARTKPSPSRPLGESILSQVESGWKPGGLRLPSFGRKGKSGLESNPFGSDWADIRRELEAELTPDKLQSRLKAMTAGDEIVVRHGRTTVRVRAVLRDKLEHLGDSGTTEFNAGTDVQRNFATTKGTGTTHQGVLGAVASVPLPHAPAVSVTGGVIGTGGHGHNQVDTQTRSTSAGAATKTKTDGSAYRGEAELQFTITRKPWGGTQVYQRRTAVIGYETIVEAGETVPATPKPAADATTSGRPETDATDAPAVDQQRPATDSTTVDQQRPATDSTTGDQQRPATDATDATTVDKQPQTVSLQPSAPETVRVPPERVWETGLRDTDILRWLGDVGGVRDLVRLRGPQYFGASTWQKMEPQVGKITTHSHLSALFGSASQGAEVAATVPSEKVLFGGGKGVEIGVKVVSLESRSSDTADVAPANTLSSGGVRYDLAANNAGAQGQVGAKITGDPTSNSPSLIGGAARFWREGGGHGDSGQVISNAKYSDDMARYTGYAEVDVTFFNGNKERVTEKGIVPFTVDIPASETTAKDVPGDHYLAFTPKQKGGEARLTEGSWRLAEVERVLTPDDGKPPTGPVPSAPAPARTPAQYEQLMGTARLGQAFANGEFTSGTDAGAARIKATHRLVELAGGTTAGTSTLLGDLLHAPDGTQLKAEEVRQVIDYVARKSAAGPITLDDLVAGAQDGWPAHEPYEIHRGTWTDNGPASELVTAAMATVADATRPLLQGGAPTPGQLHLTVVGEGPELPLRRVFDLDGSPAVEQIQKIEQATYLKPGTRPSEVTVRLAGTPGTGQDWDYRVTARSDRSRELMIRQLGPEEGKQRDPQARAEADARSAGLTRFVADRTGAPEKNA